MFKAKATRSLSVLEAILKKQGSTFAAGGKKKITSVLTSHFAKYNYARKGSFSIADISLLGAAICMEAASFDFAPYPCIAKWYEACKKQHPSAWEELKVCRDDLHLYFKNPPPKAAISKLDKMRDESFKNV